jgi:hypothetical protein
MDRTMTAAGTHPALALVRQVRNRLWLAAMLRQLLAGLWIGGGLCLLGGFWHLFFQALNPETFILLGLSPPAMALVHAMLRRRPTESQAARQADAWFQGHALLISAWELQGKPTLTPTTQLVLQRAASAAGNWREDVVRKVPLRWPQSGTLALLLAATGLLLLQLPSKALWSTPTPQPHGETSQASLGAPPPLLQAVIPETRRSTPSVAAAAQEAQARDAAGGPPDATARALPQGEAATGTPDTTVLATSSRLASAKEAGSRAGDQTGQQREQTTEPAASLLVQEQAIARHAGDQGGTGSGGGKAGIDRVAPQHDSTSVVAATRPVQPGYHAHYPPAQRHYIARYFQELQAATP